MPEMKLDWRRDEEGRAFAFGHKEGEGFRVSHRPNEPAGVAWLLEEISISSSGSVRSYQVDTFRHEADARAKAEVLALHRQQKDALDRRSVRLTGQVHTPWGWSQGAESYGEGILFHHTAGHGGFKLDRKANAAMPAPLRLKGGWYEEDCEWARVAIAFPDRFTDYEREQALRTMKEWAPDDLEAFTGEEVPLAESGTKRRRAFEAENRDKFVVVSAESSDEHPGMLKTTATLGGSYDRNAERRRFLVPKDEYQKREPFGFVIDEAKHEEMIDRTPSP